MHYTFIFFQRKFARENPEAKSSQANFYGLFKEWREKTYSEGAPSQEQWQELLKEDEKIEYDSESLVDETADEVDIESSAANDDDYTLDYFVEDQLVLSNCTKHFKTYCRYQLIIIIIVFIIS